MPRNTTHPLSHESAGANAHKLTFHCIEKVTAALYWPHLTDLVVYKALNNMAPQYLTDDSQLLTANHRPLQLSEIFK